MAGMVAQAGYSNPFSNPLTMALIGVGILVLFIVVAMTARKTIKKARSGGGDFVQAFLAKTGLQIAGDHFEGTYKGFSTKMTMGIGVNYAEAGFEVMSGLAGGGMDFHKRNLMSPKFNIDMELPGESMPPLVLKEKVGFLRTDQYMMDLIANKQVELPEIKLDGIKLKRARIFGNDADFARQVASNPELQRLLETWHYLDVRLEGDRLKFILDDNMVQATFGRRTANPDYMVQALDICAAIASSV